MFNVAAHAVFFYSLNHGVKLSIAQEMMVFIYFYFYFWLACNHNIMILDENIRPHLINNIMILENYMRPNLRDHINIRCKTLPGGIDLGDPRQDVAREQHSPA